MNLFLLTLILTTGGEEWAARHMIHVQPAFESRNECMTAGRDWMHNTTITDAITERGLDVHILKGAIAWCTKVNTI